jgi:hypothetical protein
MKREEMICRADMYEMVVENGEERHRRSMTINGQDTTGSPSVSAYTGDYPKLNYKIGFHEAQRFMRKTLGELCESNLKHGEFLTLAYTVNNIRKYEELDIGDEFYVIAFDLNRKKNERYSKDSVTRYRFSYKKAKL